MGVSLPSEPSADADRLILEVVIGARTLGSDQLRRVLEHVASAGFDPGGQERARRILHGLPWRGRVLDASDRLPTAEAHYLRHAVVGLEWLVGTTFQGYLDRLRDIILDPSSGLLVSHFQDKGWQLTVVRASGILQGPRGSPWVMVDYRVLTGHWMTAFQPRAGLAWLTRDPR